MRFFPKYTLVLSVVGLLCAPVHAMSFRCNSYVIDNGMHKAELIQKCGTPASASFRMEKRTVRVRKYIDPQTYPRPVNGTVVEVEKEVEVPIEEWIYNFGPHQFMQLVILEEGRIRSISDMGYGR